MTMKVTIKTKVEHPEQSGAVHQHDSPEVNFGCDEQWFVEGSDGTRDAELPAAGRPRRAHREEPDDRGHGRLSRTPTATSASPTRSGRPTRSTRARRR